MTTNELNSNINRNEPDLAEASEYIWKLIRNSILPVDFENWAYSRPELEDILGKEAYFRILETDYQNNEDVLHLKQFLQQWLLSENPPPCLCITWKDDTIIAINGETLALEDQFALLLVQNSWISFRQCPKCNQLWLIAVDIDEAVYHFHRLSEVEVAGIRQGNWPTTFNNLWFNRDQTI